MKKKGWMLDQDDDDDSLSFTEQKKYYEDMIAFAKEHKRTDVVEKGIKQLDLLEECIQKENELDVLKEQSQEISKENDTVSKEIEDKKKVLDEQIKEIDDELAQLEDELTKALNADPRNEQLIAQLQEQKKELEQLKQACLADKRLLESYSVRTQAISNQYQMVYASQSNFSSNLGFGSQQAVDYQAQTSFKDARATWSSSGTTPDERCDSYLTIMEQDDKQILEQKEELQQAIDSTKKLSTETVQTLNQVKKDIAGVGENIQSRAEQLAAIRQARVGRSLQSLNSAVPMTTIASESRPSFMAPMPDIKSNTKSFKP